MDAMDWVHWRSPSIATQNGILCADDLTIKVQIRVPLNFSILRHPKKTTSDVSRSNRRKPEAASSKTQNLTPCFIGTLEALL